MTTAILIPFRPDNGPRTRAAEHVHDVYARTGWELSMASDVLTGGDAPWCKAQAVRRALQLVVSDVWDPPDVLVISDADCFPVDLDELVHAVETVASGHRIDERGEHVPCEWAMPHRLVRRLSEDATRHLIDDGGAVLGTVCRSPYIGFEGGGCTVISAEAYAQCPLDPRFEGWGNEDEAWGMALRTMFGAPWRGESQLVHLWHPPAKPGHRKNYEPASIELLARYRQASKHGPDAMRALLDEVR